MNQSPLTRRGLLRLAASVAGVAGVGLMPGLALADPWASEIPAPVWVRTNSPDVSVRADASPYAERLSLVRSGTVLRIVDEQKDWKQVYDPHADATGYVHKDLLTPAAEPSRFAFSADVPVDNDLSTVAIATTDLPLYFYPTSDPLAQATFITPSDRETIVGTVTSDSGSTWLKTDDGYYLPQSDALFNGSAPNDFPGRWLDVTLSGRTNVLAYEQGDTVRSFLAVKGTARFPTPLGSWCIVRRVANETMDSATVGIPRNSPNGYYLKNVLWTQYFRPTGESLHYNWWAAASGQAGSHGCLGLSLADSRWLWDWAAIGTPVFIHA